MKNIHVLQTDKPSRLACDFDKLILNSRLLSPILYKTQNIYITSDEEIKDGDWMIRGSEQPTLVTPNFFWDFGVRYYKIILTTDQDLIKDSVQAIDDEFLEWFVKNPSCEEVLVTNLYGDFNPIEYFYEIIIPKEIQPQQIWNAEKKEGIKKLIQKHKLTTMMEQDEQLGLYQETKCHCGLELDCKDCSQSLEDCTCIEDTIDMKQSTKDRILSETSEEIKQRVRDTANKLVMKQETLEEVAKRYDGENAASGVKSFIAGAKWQQERSYSEEDLMSAFLGCWLGNVPEGVECKLYFDQWFEQFKKK
jgi:hypothetical protein